MSNNTFIIDMQHHYISPEALKLVGKTSEIDFSVGLKKFAKVYELIIDIDAHLKWMDNSGVNMAILSTAVFCANGYKFCKTCNDGYSKIVKKYPDRFKGMIHIYPYDNAGKNRDEVKRAFEELGLWGIALVTSYRNMTIGSPTMDHIYEMAIEYGMPVFIHPTIRRKLWGGERYNLDMTLSREYEIGKSFVEIVYGVLPRFPELKIVISHLGGGLPTLKGRFLAWHRPKEFSLPEVDRELGLAVDHAKELGFVDDFETRLNNIYFDSAGYGGWLPVMKSAFETLSPNHLCFGSDYPYELREPMYVNKIIENIREINASEEDKEKFFYRNLKNLFKLEI